MKKPNYAALYTLRADGRYVGSYTDERGRHYVYDRDPEKLWHKLNDPLPELTFRQLAKAWHDAHWACISAGTIASYTASYNRAVEQYGDRPAAELMTFDVNQHLLQLKNKGLGLKTIKTQRTVYHLIYQYAIGDKEIGKKIHYNPADAAVLPSGIKRPVKRDAPPDEIVNKIRAEADTAYWGLFCLFLIATGFRRGEALAIQWKDVNFKKKEISCTKEIVYRGTVICKEPKTENGIRTVPLLPDLLPVLRSAKPKDAAPEDYVFCGEDPKKPLQESTYRRRWRHYCKDMGFVDADGKHTLTAHVMRHGYATMLYDAGVDVYTAQRLLGHADVQTTLAIYTHLKESRNKEDIKKLNEYVLNAAKK